MKDDIASEILTELRKLTQYADRQRKIQKRALIVGLLLMPLFLGGLFYFETKVKKDIATSRSNQDTWDWYNVNADEEKGKLDDALEKAQYLIRQSPNYYYGYKVLGRLYLSRNELYKAKESFDKAYEILPSESNKELVDAIQIRLKREKNPNKTSE